jgi:hypothetical protein
LAQQKIRCQVQKNKIHRDFCPQLNTIQIQTNAIFPNKPHQNLTSPTPQKKNLLSFFFFSQLQIVAPYAPLSIPLETPHQSSPRIVIHICHKNFQLSNKDPTPSPKTAYLSHSIITCKTTNKTKNRKTSN